MSEPDTAADAGTAGQPEPETPETVETPAGGENPETTGTEGAGEGEGGNGPGASGEGKGEGPVPYSRFKEVNEERKAAKARAEELERKLASLDKPKDQPASKPKVEFVKPPAGLTQDELFDWYARQSTERVIAEKFGDPEIYKAAVAYVTENRRTQIVREFTEAAEARGLDPTNTALRSAVAALLDSGKHASMDSALDSIFKTKPKAQPPAKPNGGNGAARDGMSPTGMTRVKDLPMTTAEAMALTKQGKTVEQVSVMDILAAGSKRA